VRFGPRRLLDPTFDTSTITKIPPSLGLPSEPAAIAPARPPPQAEFDW